MSAAPFYKRIQNPIYTRAIVEDNVVVNGRTYERLSTSHPENADSGHIAGVELTYPDVLPFLPSPLDEAWRGELHVRGFIGHRVRTRGRRSCRSSGNWS